MTDLTRAAAIELAARIHSGEVSAEDVVQAHLERIHRVEPAVHAFLEVDDEGAIAAARAIDRESAAGGAPRSALAGVPVAVKDVLVTKGIRTTAGSKILEGWIPPYDSTVSRRLREAGLIILGKTNMDEFAMGSSTENSAYGPTHNPWALDRIPGGSGGGSSASLAAYETPLAIGSDTGGSIRQPSAMTGTVGVKPSYGGVSRYGLIAFASSLDQAGPCARSVTDAAALHEIIGGYDPLDSTSIDAPADGYVEAARRGIADGLSGLRIGIVTQLAGGATANGVQHPGVGFQRGVLEAFADSLTVLRDLGAELVDVSCPSFEHALSAYYIIAPCEASSNLARFDGIRYGHRSHADLADLADLEGMVSASRGEGFGAEVKRRIIIGTYALSAGYYDDFYGSALRIRKLVVADFDAAFGAVDLLISPTSPTTAYPIGERIEDPMAMYLTDLCTIPADLAGNCAISVPNGLSGEDGLPVGLQFMAPALGERLLYRAAAAYEAAREQSQGPLLDRLPLLP